MTMTQHGTDLRPAGEQPAALAKDDGGQEERRLLDLPTNLPPLPELGIDLMTLGRLLAASGYFDDGKRAGEGPQRLRLSQAVVKVLAGQELDIGPIRAMTEIHVVDGRIGLSASLMASLIKRSGRYDYRVRTHGDQKCEVEFFQRRSGAAALSEPESIGTSSFTMDDATRAGLPKRSPSWSTYPRNMLFARALSNGARWFCPDVFGGAVYTPEELGEETTTERAAEHPKAETAPEPTGARG